MKKESQRENFKPSLTSTQSHREVVVNVEWLVSESCRNDWTQLPSPPIRCGVDSVPTCISDRVHCSLRDLAYKRNIKIHPQTKVKVNVLGHECPCFLASYCSVCSHSEQPLCVHLFCSSIIVAWSQLLYLEGVVPQIYWKLNFVCTLHRLYILDN